MNKSKSTPCKADILVVDDNPDNLRLLSNMLMSRGYQVRKAINGQLALKGVEVSQPDLILLDINMPKINGYEVCKQLKSLENTRHIPVIFVSALDETLDKVKAFQIGGVDYITKPFQLEEVLARVENQLTIHQLQKQLYQQNTQLQLEIIERQKVEEEIKFLFTTTQLISKSVDFNDALKVTLKQVCLAINWDLGEAWIPNNKSSKLEYGTGWYTSEKSLEKFIEKSKSLTIASKYGLPGRIWTSQKFEWIEDISAATQLEFIRQKDALEVGLKTAFGIPILINEQLLTVLIFYKKELSKLEPRFVDLVHTVATQLASLIQLKKTEEALMKANQELERLATVDSLTEVANRRLFDEYLELEWLQMFREQLPLSLILCDVDFFKFYNDTYGHLVGDFCLQQVATTIKTCIKRSTDLVARYGGEEFAVILPNTDAKGALKVAEFIREKVQALKIAHAKSSVSPFVTLSLGATTVIPNPEISPDILIALTDKALYAAKQQGRNRTVLENLVAPTLKKFSSQGQIQENEEKS
ncbi:diguanylate cyclase domain-containing protein [Floridanema evergladense]|uniref:Diguanylate cyclase domain-containing protein n=1 Tax=Floridaenema evergladense BLCC-F167 TaxID=3153639 RepID=A0ABV4WV59_9CYAN